MRENLIKLDIFDVLAVTGYEAKHEVGKHGRAIIRAIIEEKREEEYVNIAKNTRWVRANALDETDKESTIFYGLLERQGDGFNDFRLKYRGSLNFNLSMNFLITEGFTHQWAGNYAT